MISVAIPGRSMLALEHLVFDYNGTLACDGELIPGAPERLARLAAQVQIHVVTADTFGRARAALADAPCALSVLPPGKQDAAKLAYVRALGFERTAAIGNGRNDRLMLRAAALGIAVLGEEGAAPETVRAADVLVPNIVAALDLLLNPLRLVATLRV